MKAIVVSVVIATLTGKMAPAEARNNIPDLCLEKCSPNNSKEAVLDPQDPGPVVEELKKKWSGDFSKKYIIIF